MQVQWESMNFDEEYPCFPPFMPLRHDRRQQRCAARQLDGIDQFIGAQQSTPWLCPPNFPRSVPVVALRFFWEWFFSWQPRQQQGPAPARQKGSVMEHGLQGAHLGCRPFELFENPHSAPLLALMFFRWQQDLQMLDCRKKAWRRMLYLPLLLSPVCSRA